MFSMFSLRRPDVLGVGDLGLQKVSSIFCPGHVYSSTPYNLLS